jgi:MFS family permease
MHTTERRGAAVSIFFIGVVLVNAAMVGASTVATLIAADAIGSTWSGTPTAAGVLGTAIGALGLAWLMASRGRRLGLSVGYSIGAGGAVLACVGVVGGVLPLLYVGMLLLGLGNGGAQLARYAAADLFAPERRGFVVGAMVWGGTIGAVVGPNLIAPTAEAATALSLPPLVGSYVLAVGAFAIASLVTVALPVSPPTTASGPAKEKPDRATWTQRPVLVALAAMVTAHFSMVAVMTMTPLHIQQHGQGLHVVGGVLTAHMLGMFAFAPLSGRLADVFGAVRVIVGGSATLLAAAVVAAVAQPTDTTMLALALFLLGYGWNLCFVGGSSMLSREVAADERTRVQGGVDAVVWSTSALASFASGGLLASGGYPALAAVAGAIALIPLVVIPVVQRSKQGGEKARAAASVR